MNINTIREKLPASLTAWADQRIADMVQGNPTLAIPSVYMRRAAHNIIGRYGNMIDGHLDGLALFLADENGEVDEETLFNDLMQMLDAIEPKPYNAGIIHGSIGGGAVTIELPDNLATDILLGNKKTIRITREDFAELKAIMTGGA